MEARKVGLTDLSRVDALVAALGRERHWVLGLAELRAEGISDKEIRTRVEDGRLRRLHRGVFAIGPGPVSQHGGWRAAALAGNSAAYVSHLHGGAVRGLAKPPHGPVDVTVDGWRRSRRSIRFHSASLSALEIDEVDAIPVTSLARTLLDVAATQDELTLRRMYERAERLQILDLTPIRKLLVLRRGHRGAARLRALLDYDPAAAADALSELERLYLDLLRRAGLPEPQVNVLVDGYLVDCYWPDFDLIVELDSYEFHGDREAFERDRAKIADLRAAGHQAVQFTYRQVTGEPEWVAARTRALMVRGAASRSAL